jgi:hypothetical protein
VLEDQITDVQLKAFEAITNPFKAFLKDPVPFMDPGCHWHMQAEGPGTDRATILNAFEDALRCNDEVSPLLEAGDYIYDIFGLLYNLDRWEYMLEEATKNLSLQCTDCRPFTRLFQAARNWRGSHHLIRLTESQKVHLKRKREESGIGAD